MVLGLGRAVKARACSRASTEWELASFAVVVGRALSLERAKCCGRHHGTVDTPTKFWCCQYCNDDVDNGDGDGDDDDGEACFELMLCVYRVVQSRFKMCKSARRREKS
ncbi:hypothetical protein Micbo1qcDRAFT_162776, partial [Microdochium bolleyi]